MHASMTKAFREAPTATRLILLDSFGYIGNEALLCIHNEDIISKKQVC